MKRDTWESFEQEAWKANDGRSRFLRLVELLEGDPKEVWEIAGRLFDDGWDGDIPDLVLAARLLAGGR